MSPDPSVGRPPDTAAAGSWVSRARYDDIDLQAAHFRGYGQHYEQLSRGPFEGRFSSFLFDADLAIHYERANRVLAQSASTPPGRFGACILADAAPHCVLNAALLGPDDVVVCPAGRSLEGTTPEGMRIFCLDLGTHLLPEPGMQMLGTGVLRDAQGVRQLRELLQVGVTRFMSLSSPADLPVAARDFRSSLADLLWQLAERPAECQPGTRQRRTARSLVVFRRARERIHHGLDEGVSINAVCSDIGISRRSLESVFRCVVGLGPAQYVRLVQLNRIRRDLLSPVAARESIGIVAARHGVWHWSRFSQAYRAHFGELPSQTRRRTLSDGTGSDPD